MVLPSNYGEGNILNNITSFAKYGIPLVDVFDTVFLIELQLLDILLDLHCDVVFSPPVHLCFLLCCSTEDLPINLLLCRL